MGVPKSPRQKATVTQYKEFVGAKGFRVWAKGAKGQKLLIDGTDQWTGGVGIQSNDTIFGGIAVGGGWSSDGPTGIVASRYLRAISVTAAKAPLITHSGGGNPATDGDITITIDAMIHNIDTDVANAAIIGLWATATLWIGWGFKDVGGDLFAYPYANDGSIKTGGDIAINADTIHRFKIIWKDDDTADFYFDNTFQETIAGGDLPPNNADMVAGVSAWGGSDILVKRVKAQYGTT